MDPNLKSGTTPAKLDDLTVPLAMHGRIVELVKRVAALGDLGGDSVRTLAALLLARCYSSFLAVRELAKVGLPEDAGVVCRSMVNAVINLVWIMAEDSVTRTKRYFSWGSWLAPKKLQLKLKRPDIWPNLQAQWDQNRIEMEANAEAAVVEFGFGDWAKDRYGWSGVSLRKMAEQSDLLTYYEHTYSDLSTIEHSDSIGVSNFLEIGSTSSQIQFGQKWTGLRGPVLLACDLMIRAMKAFDKAMGSSLSATIIATESECTAMKEAEGK